LLSQAESDKEVGVTLEERFLPLLLSLCPLWVWNKEKSILGGYGDQANQPNNLKQAVAKIKTQSEVDQEGGLKGK
jgi:hypothetical protein